MFKRIVVIPKPSRPKGAGLDVVSLIDVYEIDSGWLNELMAAIC